MRNLNKGIFWWLPAEKQLISVMVVCNNDGQALEPVQYSSKSGENFNHKIEWDRLPQSITEGLPYNYFPRGRVEIRKGRATIYLNPVLCRDDIQRQICAEFGLDVTVVAIRFVADGSAHYKAMVES